MTSKRQNRECPGKELCPLGIEHPKPGSTYALGCSACRAEDLEKLMKENPNYAKRKLLEQNKEVVLEEVKQERIGELN